MPANNLPLEKVVLRTSTLIRRMMDFWKNANGWAPVEAAALLNKSMLEWQSSLGDCLQAWTGDLTQGQLILAWANIGALVEGQLKLLLSVRYNDYIADVDAIKNKHGDLVDPDSVTLEPLRVFFKKKIWGPSESWDDWILSIQQRRNAIHAFKLKEIGTTEDLHDSLRTLLYFVRSINNRLPYPDELYVPREF